MSSRFLTTEEVAALARTTAATVRYWRYLGNGPVGFKVGKRVLYDEADVRTWLEGLRSASAS